MTTKAIAIETWIARDSSETIEKRTYKSGKVRYYMGMNRKWLIETQLALHYINKEIFISIEQKEKLVKEEWEAVGRRVLLMRAQEIGGFDRHGRGSH